MSGAALSKIDNEKFMAFLQLATAVKTSLVDFQLLLSFVHFHGMVTTDKIPFWSRVKPYLADFSDGITDEVASLAAKALKIAEKSIKQVLADMQEGYKTVFKPKANTSSVLAKASGNKSMVAHLTAAFDITLDMAPYQVMHKAMRFAHYWNLDLASGTNAKDSFFLLTRGRPQAQQICICSACRLVVRIWLLVHTGLVGFCMFHVVIKVSCSCVYNVGAFFLYFGSISMFALGPGQPIPGNEVCWAWCLI